MNAFLKFIKSLRSLYNQGVIKSVDEAMEFAKNEFGEITEFLEAQIKKVFKKAPEKKKKSEGIMDAEVVNIDSKKIVDERTDDLMGKNEKSEGIMDIADKMSKKADELKKLVDESKVTEKSIIEDALDAATGFQRPLGSKDKSKPFRTHKMEYKRDSEDYRIPGGSSYAEGNLRTAIRQFLRTEAKEGRIKLSDDDMFRITEYSPMMEDDPIDVFRRYYGEDALEAASDMADELRFGESYKHYEEIFRKEMGDLKVKTEGAGQYDQSILDAERIMKEAAEEAKNKKILEDFDPTGRDKNATGGRPGYAFGTGLKLLKLFGGAKKLQKAIDDAVDNLNPSGDKKLDADNAIDDMLEEAGIDRDAVDQYDIIDAYGKAYERITSGKVFKQVDDMLEEQFPGVTEQIEAVTKQSSASIKRDTIARRLGLDPFKLNEQQKMILDKYGNRIDDDLLKNILVDDDPQRIAEVSATLDEAFIMQDKGMGPDEILETVKNTKRTKQAMGTGPDGLSEITELFEKIKVKNENKKAEKKSDQQIRYRKLIESNQFPELNEFFQAKINESDGDMNVELRMNAQTGGPFTQDFLDQRKKQSLLDFRARQGTQGSTSSRTGYTGPGFNLSTPATGGTTGGSSGTQPGTGSGTGGTSGGSGVIPGYRNYQPNPGITGGGNTGGSSGGSGIIGVGNTGGGRGGPGTQTPFDPGLPIGASSGAEAIAAYKKYLAGVDRTTTPFKSFDEWRKGTSQYSTDQLLYDLNTEEGQNQFKADKAYLAGLKGWDDPRLTSGREAIAAYEEYLRTSAGLGAPLSFDSFRRGTRFADQLTFDEDDFYKLQNIKKAVSGGYREDGTYDTSGLAGLGYGDMKGYTGDDPRGTSDGYQYEEGDEDISLQDKVDADNRDPNEETLLEKRKREKEEAEQDLYADEEGGDIDYTPPAENISSITESSKDLNVSDPSDYSQFINRNANKVVGRDSKGKIFTLNNLIKAGLFLASGGLSGGIEQALKTAAKQYVKKKSIEYAKDKFNIGNQEELPEGAIASSGGGLNSSAFPFSEGGRVNKAIGGPIDYAQRARQSQADFLARQPGAQPQTPTAPPAQPVVPQPQQPATPQPKPNFPKPFPMTPGGPKPATPTTPATTAAQPQPAGPFDMSKYQGGTFTGGIEDSRNISLNQLAELGVDVSKYRTMTPTDTSGPKFKGLSLNEIFAMDLNTAKEKLGFDPSVEGANPEFEEFLRVNDPGPQLIGPGGPPGMKTEFKNQDELAQILNRAIPFYMRTARDLGENYTLQEMLAMTDEELAALDDRYDKKMGYGKYAKRPGNTYNTYNTEGIDQYNEMQRRMGEIKREAQKAKGSSGNTLNYSTGGRVGFSTGSAERKRISRMMDTDYSNPFTKLTRRDFGRHNSYNNALLRKGKKMISADKKKKKNLLTLNEKARAKALQRLNLLKKLYTRA